MAKKIGRALGRGEVGDAARLEKSKPRMRLDHIVKERYPTFVDALRDLDDALSMLFLFANLPSTAHIPSKTITLCQRLCLDFEHYLIVSHSLRKSFLSIKGIYYQATIQGQDILWLIPYKFVQRMTGDIDFRIMGTFVEFYTTLLGFVNYRLYTSVGLVYPPKFDTARDDKGAELGAFTLEGTQISSANTNGVHESAGIDAEATVNAQAEADRLFALESENDEIQLHLGDAEGDGEEVDEAIDKFESAAAQDADILPQPQLSSAEAATLFADFTFYLSRETPRPPLEFLLKAFGCKRVGWDAVLGDGAFTSDENDPTITHQVVDRPNLPPNAFPSVSGDDADQSNGESTERPSAIRVPGRTYVQPQWVWDCINQGKLLRPDWYAPGATLPPHLSPWVKPKSGQYDPTIPLAEQEKEDEAQLHEEELEAEEQGALEGAGEVEEEGEEAEEESHDEEGDVLEESRLLEAGEIEAGEGMEVDLNSSDEEDIMTGKERQPDIEWGGVSDDEAEVDLSDGELERLQFQRELEAEAAGVPFSTVEAGRTPGKAISEARKKANRKRKEKQEELDRQRMMLPNKKRKLFDKMQYGNKLRDAEAEKLRKKRRKLERRVNGQAT